MPTVFMMLKPCYVCGAEGRCPDIGAHGSYHGPRDLDTRPSVSQRSSIYMWVQRCQNCGYCGPDIAKGDDLSKEVVDSEEYQKQLTDSAYTETANSFLCRSMILEKLGDFVEAGWACVYAAWVCDDSGFDKSAAKCRGRAIELFRRAQTEKMPFAPSRGEEIILLVDLLRRSREFDEAAKLADVELSLDDEERTKTILTYEMDLIEEKDSAIHTESEAFEE